MLLPLTLLYLFSIAVKRVKEAEKGKLAVQRRVKKRWTSFLDVPYPVFLSFFDPFFVFVVDNLSGREYIRKVDSEYSF